MRDFSTLQDQQELGYISCSRAKSTRPLISFMKEQRIIINNNKEIKMLSEEIKGYLELQDVDIDTYETEDYIENDFYYNDEYDDGYYY